MAEKQVPKGRGTLLEMLRKHKEARLGVGEQTEELPPKSRGRAALLEKMQSLKKKKVGEGEPVEPQAAATSTERKSVETVTQGVSELSVTSTEICSYRGKYYLDLSHL
jgi:hypothetical protein